MRPPARCATRAAAPAWQAWLAIALLCWLAVPCAAAGGSPALALPEHCHAPPGGDDGDEAPPAYAVCHHCLCAAAIPSQEGAPAALRNDRPPWPTHAAVTMRRAEAGAYRPLRIDKPRAFAVHPLQTTLKHRALLI
ncbi:MAG: hypothetical protein R3F45_03690 [Gammaproteobacteria bacterium]